MRKFGIILIAMLSYSIINSQTWEEVSSLPSSFQTDHSYGFAINGKGYVVSGKRAGNILMDRVYEYDPSLDEWNQLDDFPGGARGFAIGDIMDGKAYFGFGTDNINYLDDLWVFDPADGSWTELSPCDCSGRLHPAMVAIDGKIYVGLGNNDTNLNDWWEYDVATDTWEIKAAFPGAPRHHPYMFGMDGYVYAGFGHGTGFISDEWYRYDPVSNTWDQMADIPAQGRVAGSQFSYNGRGYALSGEGENHSTMDTGELWEYDPISDSWNELPPHPGNSRWAPASFVLDGEIYIINGMVRTGFSSTYVSENYKLSLAEVVSVRENNLAENKRFSIYPNPAGSEVRFDLAGLELDKTQMQIRVYNNDMQLVQLENGFPQTIDVSALSAGFYWVEIISGDQVYRQRMVKA